MCQAQRHTHPYNGPLYGTTRVSRYQKSKTNLDFTEAGDSEWQWNQLGSMQVCTSLHQTTIMLYQVTDYTQCTIHRKVDFAPDL